MRTDAVHPQPPPPVSFSHPCFAPYPFAFGHWGGFLDDLMVSSKSWATTRDWTHPQSRVAPPVCETVGLVKGRVSPLLQCAVV